MRATLIETMTKPSMMLLCLAAAAVLVGCGGGEAELGEWSGADGVDAVGGDTAGGPDGAIGPAPIAPLPDATSDTFGGGADTWTGGPADAVADTSDTTSADTGIAPDTTSTPDTTVEPDTAPADTTEPDAVEPPPGPQPGGLCSSPCNSHDQCGGPNDLCLVNNNTGESFCGQFCQSQADCPGGFTCASVGGYPQCVPDSQTCQGFVPPQPCDPACPSGQVCSDGQCIEGGQWEVEQQHCVDVINGYRIAAGLEALQRASDLEACATQGAIEDSQTGVAHGHFQATQGCNLTARAENEIPGWSGTAASVMGMLESGTQMMFDEGPGGGHHDNMMNPFATAVGCGIHVTADNKVWIVQDFR